MEKESGNLMNMKLTTEQITFIQKVSVLLNLYIKLMHRVADAVGIEAMMQREIETGIDKAHLILLINLRRCNEISLALEMENESLPINIRAVEKLHYRNIMGMFLIFQMLMTIMKEYMPATQTWRKFLDGLNMQDEMDKLIKTFDDEFPTLTDLMKTIEQVSNQNRSHSHFYNSIHLN